jgi:hypothetical protein
MRRIPSRDDERRDLELEQILGLRARRCVAIEKRAASVLHDPFVLRQVLLHVRRGERWVASDDGCPWPAARLGVKRLAFLLYERDDALQPLLFDECEVLRKARMTVDAIFRATDRPVKNHAERRLRMRDCEGNDRRAAHARAHDVSALDP